MAPQRNAHVYSVTRVADLLRAAFGPDCWVRVQAPLGLSGLSEPEPDVAVVSGPPVNSPDHPTAALLVVEVSDTSLRYDRGEKASLYARAGIADYWIVNLEENQLEMHREPVPDDRARFGWRYQTVSILQKGQLASPLAKAEATVGVGEMLP
jgi:Uma2 family endonuclease